MRLWLDVTFVAFIEFYGFEEILNFFVFPSFPDQVSHSDLAGVKENIFDKILDFFVFNLIGDGEYLKAGATGAVHHKLQLNMFQIVNLIEIEHVE